ncbi:MAG TPA: sensor histidine kinase [Streptosporangiaceae bacterium]|nr:sensor histidine kinase [Streptosporangiaceae bacterium]
MGAMTDTGGGASGGAAAARPGRWRGGPFRTYAGFVSGCAPGTGSPWWRWLFSGIWLLYLVQPVLDLFGRGHPAVWIAGGLAITAVFCAVYVAVLGKWDCHPLLARWGLTALAALAVLACLIYGRDWVALWLYVSVATGFAYPGRRRAMLAVIGVTGCFALFSWLTHAPLGEFLGLLLPVVLVGWAMIGFRLQIQLMRELRQAREVVAKLAASEERLRLARDMHDLTGQSLSLITLKTELAARMLGRLPASAERDAALAEITAIGQVSRQTLHDIREAVSGYRRPTLAVEVITARASLEAAGIRPDDDPGLTLRSGSFDPDAEAALAWCLREAVTNVIRHSGARNCRIRLTERGGDLSLDVSDDGRGSGGSSRKPARGGGAADVPQDGETPRGSGLHGMAERLSAVGGRLCLAPPAGDSHGFRLIATVPLVPGHGGESRAGDAAASPVRPTGPEPEVADAPRVIGANVL